MIQYNFINANEKETPPLGRIKKKKKNLLPLNSPVCKKSFDF
jgi:hypothetical protein